MRSVLLSLFALALWPHAATAQESLKIEGTKSYKPYSLVRLKATGVDPKAGIVWRIYPSAGVQRATTPRGLLEFVAPPGSYSVETLVVKTGVDGGVEIEEATTAVEIEPCCDKPKPEPKIPDPKPKPKSDPSAALGRITFGSAGCTATVIGPRRSDGKWDVLTATHCITKVGQRGTMTMKDGRKLNVTVTVKSKTIEEGGPDCAWLVTDESPDDLPFATLAEKNPAIGVKIWHQGYGVHIPGNREDGEITADEDSGGQLEMRLSVSSGDSGGGIFRDDTGELVSCVCCTSAKGQRARVWGSSVEAARRLRPRAVSLDEWAPAEMPQPKIYLPPMLPDTASK